jgi:hypothetical protein
MVAPRGQYAINYFPIDNGGYQMWGRSYDGSRSQADMAAAKNLGFNTIRVNLPAKMGYFDFSRPTAAQLANLADFSYTFSCALAKGYSSAAPPSLQISWYDSSGRYIFSNNGRPLALSSSFDRYYLSGTAPPGAAYARLFVRVGYNSGRIWVGGATWTYAREQPA